MSSTTSATVVGLRIDLIRTSLIFLGFTSPLFYTTAGGWQKTACAARGSAIRLVGKVYHINTKIVKLVKLDEGGGAVEAICEVRHASNKIRRIVSIPFKREGISKDRNGNRCTHKRRVVSIPFKRESISKDKTVAAMVDGTERFNSLQTGKHIQRILNEARLSEDTDVVSIPFKRESISKVKKNLRTFYNQFRRKVSIPFKRESISKALKNRRVCARGSSFNSLQTGKHIQS